MRRTPIWLIGTTLSLALVGCRPENAEAGTSSTRLESWTVRTVVPAGADTVDVATVFRQMGCLVCHRHAGNGGVIAPSFDSLTNRDPDYLRRSIESPAADVARGYEAYAGVMPPGLAERMTAEELDAVVRYLSTSRAERE